MRAMAPSREMAARIARKERGTATENGTRLDRARQARSVGADPTPKDGASDYCATQFATIAFQVRSAMTTEPVAFG